MKQLIYLQYVWICIKKYRTIQNAWHICYQNDSTNKLFSIQAVKLAVLFNFLWIRLMPHHDKGKIKMRWLDGLMMMTIYLPWRLLRHTSRQLPSSIIPEAATNSFTERSDPSHLSHQYDILINMVGIYKRLPSKLYDCVNKRWYVSRYECICK